LEGAGGGRGRFCDAAKMAMILGRISQIGLQKKFEVFKSDISFASEFFKRKYLKVPGMRD
jgi:hypothetical protein